MEERMFVSVPEGRTIVEENNGSDLVKELENIAAASYSKNTEALKRSAWKRFVNFGKDPKAGVASSDDELVVLFIAHCRTEGLKTATIKTYVSLITGILASRGRILSDQGLQAVKKALRGISKLGVPPLGKTPVTTPGIRAMCSLTGDTLFGLQQRALILLGYASGGRASEVVGLNVEDLTFEEEGLVYMLHRSKTDREGMGRAVSVVKAASPEFCPVLTLKRLLRETGRTEGPVFRTPYRTGIFLRRRLSLRYYDRLVKNLARKADLEGDFGGHSLRSGHVTQAVREGVDHLIIARQTGHRDLNSLKRYVRLGPEFRKNSSGYLGL
ncbi:MAG: site-specific integrase [Simkaniaceae bacterium]|nr:site-specific integrase [Simkaniaceae bacterium]